MDQRFKIEADMPGSAHGVCEECGARLSVFMPEYQRAVEALLTAFNEHYTAKHPASKE